MIKAGINGQEAGKKSGKDTKDYYPASKSS